MKLLSTAAGSSSYTTIKISFMAPIQSRQQNVTFFSRNYLGIKMICQATVCILAFQVKTGMDG